MRQVLQVDFQINFFTVGRSRFSIPLSSSVYRAPVAERSHHPARPFSQGEARIFTEGKSETLLRFQFPEEVKGFEFLNDYPVTLAPRRPRHSILVLGNGPDIRDVPLLPPIGPAPLSIGWVPAAADGELFVLVAVDP